MKKVTIAIVALFLAFGSISCKKESVQPTPVYSSIDELVGSNYMYQLEQYDGFAVAGLTPVTKVSSNTIQITTLCQPNVTTLDNINLIINGTSITIKDTIGSQIVTGTGTISRDANGIIMKIKYRTQATIHGLISGENNLAMHQ